MKLGRRIYRHFNVSYPRLIAGRWIRIPVLGGQKPGLSGEVFMLDILRHFLPKTDGAVVDVGANLGQTLCKVKIADSERQYFGFEPNAACHNYLETLIRANAWTNTTVFPCGLSDRTTILRLHVSDSDATDARGSLLASVRPDLQQNGAKYVSLFEFGDIGAVSQQKLGFVKIDVEGAELEVLRGMSQAIARDRPIIAIELMPVESLKIRHEQSVALLMSLAYDVYLIEKASDKSWRGLTELEQYMLPDDPNVNDYLAIPRDSKS